MTLFRKIIKDNLICEVQRRAQRLREENSLVEERYIKQYNEMLRNLTSEISVLNFQVNNEEQEKIKNRKIMMVREQRIISPIRDKGIVKSEQQLSEDFGSIDTKENRSKALIEYQETIGTIFDSAYQEMMQRLLNDYEVDN